MLRHTPFHSRTAPLVRGETWRRWAGHLVASSYETSPEREYAAVRNSAALFDISPLCKYRISGKDATRLLDRMLTRDLSRCDVGRVLYTPWCDARGKIIDDGTVTRLDEHSYRLTSAEPSLRWLTLSAQGMQVEISDISGTTAAAALQGPLSRDILQALTDHDIASLRYFRAAAMQLGGVPVMLTRTGYTGDLGYEIWTDAVNAVPLWDTLIRAGGDYGIAPAGIWALDIARIEAGLIMAGVDYHSAHHAVIESQFSSPAELGLEWTVSREKGAFTGRRALYRELAAPGTWRLVGIAVDWTSLERLHAERGLAPRLPAVAWRSSVPIYANGEQRGYATSGCWSPLLKQYIALAHIRAPHHTPGSVVSFELTVEHQRKLAAATVVKLPFLDLPRKRA